MNEQVIIVTGRRKVANDGTPVAGWLFQAARNGSGSGSGNQSGSGNTVFHNEEELMEAISEMRPGDHIILRLEGMPPVVIDGSLANGFFASAFNQMVGLLAAVGDGRLQAALPSINPNFRPHVEDLINDFREALQEGKFIRISNTNDLAAAARQFNPDYNITEDDTGFTWGAPINDTSNLDGDPSTGQYHQIYFDMRRIVQLESNSPTVHGYQRSYESFQIQLYHELFHIVEGDIGAIEEIQRLGSTVANHDYPFDRAAAALYNQVRRMEFDLTITGEAPTFQLHLGTSGSDTLSVNLGGDGAASIDLGPGNDTVYVPFSQSLVDTGGGDDTLIIQNGLGRIMWMDESGSDILQIAGASSLADLAIERFGDWTYIALKGAADANKSASELPNVVMFDDAHGPETVLVGGQSYSIAYVNSLANSKPDFYGQELISFQAPFHGGLITTLIGVDFDADAVTYSVVNVAGIGSGSSWWFSGSNLYTSTHYNIPDNRLSTVTVRISDGQLYQDYDVVVQWTPDPYGDDPPYRELRDLGGGNPKSVSAPDFVKVGQSAFGSDNQVVHNPLSQDHSTLAGADSQFIVG